MPNEKENQPERIEDVLHRMCVLKFTAPPATPESVSNLTMIYDIKKRAIGFETILRTRDATTITLQQLYQSR